MPFKCRSFAPAMIKLITSKRTFREIASWRRLLLTLFLATATTGVQSAEVTVLRGTKVWDGTGTPAIEGADVVIRGDRIVSVGAAESQELPADATVVDCSGKTLIPGLISAHSHVGQVDGVESGAGNYNRDNILRQLRQYEAYGVTSIAALGLNGPLFYQLREKLHAGELPGSDLFGADRGIGVADGAPPALAVKVAGDQLDRPASPAAAREAVRAAKNRGADLIKIWVDDFRGSLPVKMSPEIYAAVIDEAHQAGLRVAAHVFYLDDAKSLIEAGVDILAHGVRDQPVDQEFIDLLKSHDVWYIATIGVDESAYIYADQPQWMQEPFFLNALQPALRTQLGSPEWRAGILANRKLGSSRDSVAMNQRNLAAIHQGGGKIGFGADSGANPLRIPGFAEHRELQLICDAGISPLEALKIATSNSAVLLQLADRGTLAPGQLADIVILDADPSQNIRNAQRINAVWHRGKKTAGRISDFTP